ncbi:MAG: IS1595 family transposase, partial [Bacteroidota bacterium]
FRMQVIPDLRAGTIADRAGKAISPRASILTTNFGAYNQLKDRFARHLPVRAQGKKAVKLLPWVHISVTNVKRNLSGIFHGVSEKYLQNYLDEFCYKLNRRYEGESRFATILGNSLRHWNKYHVWQRSG